MRALAALIAVALLAGCGSSSRTVDSAAIESGIKQQVATPTASVTKVSCPDDVKAEQGATFNCSVSWSNGATGKVKVTQEGAKRYTYEPVEGSVQVPGASVETQIQAQLAKQGAPNAKVNCPDNIIVKLDTTVTCDITSGGGKAGGSVTFTFTSVEGTVDPASVETA